MYFRQCALSMSCRQLAESALFLAVDGTDPVTGQRMCSASRARRINALMLMCGHYDNSGQFAFEVGFPGKSGVGGGILASVPLLVPLVVCHAAGELVGYLKGPGDSPRQIA